MSFLNRFVRWRERGWEEISANDYANAWQRYGGSVMTHPDIVERLSGIADMPVRYLAYPSQHEILGVLATWGRYIALSRLGLKHHGKKRAFDLGNAEIMLPFAETANIPLRFSGDYISARHASSVRELRPQKEQLAMVRPLADYSKKFLYNQRRELRLFQEDNGEIRDIHEFTPDELALIYAELFERRWGFAVPAHTTLSKVMRCMLPFMMGSVLFHKSTPIAFQQVYRVDSPNWISIEYINGGVDPAYQAYSPGSVLCYLNILAAHSAADAAGKSLRYSFGRADREYKMRWCHPQTVYRT